MNEFSPTEKKNVHAPASQIASIVRDEGSDGLRAAYPPEEANYGEDFRERDISAVSISNMMMWKMALELDPELAKLH